MRFRELKAEEIEVRVSRVSRYSVDLLLYKDARCDARILDEQVGPEHWQSDFDEHKGTLFCKVGIWVEDMSQWVWKADAGAPSNMEAQKGEASDAFKRACFKWGIGRELYTAPRIKVDADKCAEIKQGKNGNLQCWDEFHVEKIRVEDGRITGLSIWNDTTGHRCFTWVKEESDGKQQR